VKLNGLNFVMSVQPSSFDTLMMILWDVKKYDFMLCFFILYSMGRNNSSVVYSADEICKMMIIACL
jgi:hypothetical protein